MHLADDIARRLESLPGPRSLVEIGLGPAEVAALRQWAATVHPRALEAKPRQFALVFLACATAAARENFAERVLWSHVRRWFIHKDSRQLFVNEDNPCRVLKDAIERTVRHFDLRHAFDRHVDEHRVYVTVLLQCGFTRPGLARLSEWLAGRRPWRSVELLLEDPGLASSSFRDTFERLREVRLGWREHLPPTAWLDGDLAPLACQAARLSLNLGTSAAGAPPTPGIRLVDAAGGWLSFRVPIELPESASATGHPHLDIELGGRPPLRALRQADGSYVFSAVQHLDVAQAPAGGLVPLSIRDPGGTVLHEADLEAFAGEEDIDVFEAAGVGEYRRVADPWDDMISQGAVVLRVADDLSLGGSFSAPAILAEGSRWQRVQASELRSVQVPFDGDLSWTPLINHRMRWQGTVKVDADQRPWAPGGEMAWTVRLDPGRAQLQAARLGRHRLKVMRGPTGTYRLALAAAAELPRSFSLRLCLTEGDHRFTVASTVPAPPCGRLFTRTIDGWRAVECENLSSLAHPVRWFAGAPSEDLPWLFEGRRPVLPLGDRPLLLAPRLAGLGAPLSVERRRFNHDGGWNLSVALGGSQQLTLHARGTTWPAVELPAGLEWRDGFALSVLGDDGVVRELAEEQLERHERRIVLRGHASPAGVALTYRGDAIASTYSGRLPRAVEAAVDLAACVEWLLWARAPVASPTVRREMVRALEKQPLVGPTLTLRSAHGRTGAPGLAADASRGEFVTGFWRECVCEVLPALDAALGAPEPAVSDLLLEPAHNPFAASEAGCSDNRVAAAIRHLARLTPIVAARVFQAACRSTDRSLQRVIPGAKAELLADSTAPSLDGIADLLGVDERFLQVHLQAAVGWALGDSLTDERRDNVHRLLYVPEFRRSVAAAAIHRQILQEPDARRRPGHR